MTIRRRLTLSFLLVLLLFGLNLVVFFWSSSRRQETVEELRRASSRQLLISKIREDLNDVQKQVTLLSQVLPEAAQSGAGPDDVARFAERLSGIGADIGKLHQLSKSGEQQKVEAFEGAFGELAKAWRVFYENLGVRQSIAISELVMHAEPLGQRVMQELLPELQREERKLVEDASANFYSVARLTAQITIVIFVLSAVVAVAVAYRMSRYLVRGLGNLEHSAARIGGGDFGEEIAIPSRDELGDLARVFDNMRAHLLSARTQLTQANEELERRHEELRVARDAAEAASRAKSGFLANMSHELRTPMNAIIGYSEMLIEEGVQEGRAALVADLRKINSAGHHLLTVINDILDLSKIETGKMDLYPETFDVAGMIQDVAATIRPMVEKNSNVLEMRCAADLGRMRSDLAKVRQSLLNLLSNASKFTSAGKVVLEASRDGEDWVTFRVVDSGIGMNTEELSRVFDAFTQADASISARYGGTGLGLTITRKFCQLMGGTLDVQSEPGKGTSFTLRLPAQAPEPQPERPAAPAEAAQPAPAPRAAGAMTALVIDDDPVVRDLMKNFLGREGYRVVAACSGEEGLRLAKEVRPQAITLDVIMPGLDGWRVLSALKSDPELADTPVILLTIMDDKSMGYALGASEYLTKPIERDRLLAVLKKYRRQVPALSQ